MPIIWAGKLFRVLFLYFRKKIILYCYLIGAVSVLFASFAQDWNIFMIALIVTGCGISPYTTLTFVLLNEISGFYLYITFYLNKFYSLIFKDRNSEPNLLWLFHYHGELDKLYLFLLPLFIKIGKLKFFILSLFP